MSIPVDPVPVPLSPKLRLKVKKSLGRGGSLMARKRASKTIRADMMSVLITGGIVVKKEGYVMFKKEGFMNGWKKRYIVFEGGLLKVFDPAVVTELKHENNNRKSLMPVVSSADRRKQNWLEKADEIIDIVQLKELNYGKRNSSQFSLIVRPGSSDKRSSKRNSKAQQLNHNSTLSRASKSPTDQKRSSKKHFSLLPLSRSGHLLKNFHFKALSGSEGDKWVQSILFELRNQATCLADTIIAVKEHNKNDNEKLDMLHRQCLDLWALAKGKISTETLDALKKFVDFMEAEQKEKNTNVYYEEIEGWKETKELVSQRLESGEISIENPESVKNGLQELQLLNEPEYHMEKDPMEKKKKNFLYTERIINKENDADHEKNTSSGVFKVPSFLMLRRRKISKASSVGKSQIDLDDIVVNFNQRPSSADQKLNKMFKSAVDIKADREQKQEAEILAVVRTQRRTANQLQEADETEIRASL